MENEALLQELIAAAYPYTADAGGKMVVIPQDLYERLKQALAGKPQS